MHNMREQGIYSLPEAANYLRIPPSTLRAWCFGQSSGGRRFQSIIQLPNSDVKALSFVNLIEAYVLDAIRKQHKVTLQNVRKSLDYLKKEFPSKHLLADQLFETDGVDLFIDKYGSLINISKEGQTEMKEAIRVYLSRIERDQKGLPIRLFPFTRGKEGTDPKSIVIDPSVSFGRPIIAGKGVPTSSVVSRFKAGDSIELLSEDFRITPAQIEEAIRCEYPEAA